MMKNGKKVTEYDKISVSIPPKTNAKFDYMMNYFESKNKSYLVTLGLEVLYWVMKQHEDDFDIIAQKNESDKTIIREIPITKKI